MADNGHYGKQDRDVSRQGTYIFTATGTFLASINDLSADSVLATLETGLAKWNALPETEKAKAIAKPLSPAKRWESKFPSDGLVFTIFSRDLPRNGLPDSERLETWNRDSAWFSKEERERIIPGKLGSDSEFEFPKFFVERLAKLHFVDMVKGQTEGFEESEIEGSKMIGKVTSRSGDEFSIEITGQTSGQRGNGRFRRGVKTRLLGQLKYNEVTKAFSKFDFVATGQRWGRTRFNDRRDQMESTPIGFTFELSDANDPPLVPGVIWSYDAPWLVLE